MELKNSEKEVDAILLGLSTQIRGANFVPGQTCFIFDEIQDCPDARTSLKFFKEDGRYDVIATGSLLGVQGYGEKKKKRKKKKQENVQLGKNSIPVGYEDIVQMYPLDFEEFLWANGISDQVISFLRDCMAKDYKKFQYNLIRKGARAEEYVGSLQWLEDAGMIHRCYNTEATGLPMEGNAIESVFKVYITDIGLLVTMLGGSTRSDIIQGNLGGFKGAIYENLMADILHKKEQGLYYYRKESGMELDFLIDYKGECVPAEVKAKNARAKSLSTALKHPDNYHIYHALKFGDYNVGREGALLTLPNYMEFLLDLQPEEFVLAPVDSSSVNSMVDELMKQK